MTEIETAMESILAETMAFTSFNLLHNTESSHNKTSINTSDSFVE